ncbi:comm domain-containing protein [Anaeramoeba flamelloides]|uniref:Comm domain-containing protein n=1 Tax=Anaeramoeba flamelloides TaxID=1746091 RepID=A0AAV7Y965_9EUKA|nr:comm domain-containing protein [Anaeramoeba flamelloides]
MSYHSVKNPKDKKLLTVHLKRISEVKIEDPQKFLHHVIDQICEKKISFTDIYGFQTSQLSDIVAAFTKLSKGYIGKGLSDEQLLNDLETASVPKGLAKIIYQVLNARKDEIENVLKVNSVKIGKMWLKDFDWRINHVVSSSELSEISEPIFSLFLYLVDPNNEEREVILEMNKKELEEFIGSLTKSKKVLQNLNF